MPTTTIDISSCGRKYALVVIDTEFTLAGTFSVAKDLNLDAHMFDSYNNNKKENKRQGMPGFRTAVPV